MGSPNLLAVPSPNGWPLAELNVGPSPCGWPLAELNVGPSPCGWALATFDTFVRDPCCRLVPSLHFIVDHRPEEKLGSDVT